VGTGEDIGEVGAGGEETWENAVRDWYARESNTSSSREHADGDGGLNSLAFD
jgi:hypothetical protein